jgi:ABC-type multidrug transport system ATPase subunit
LPEALVELRGVVKRYGRARPVLDGVGLTLAGGEVVRVGGVNGSGKSTLLRLVAGVSTASGGIVTRRVRATGYVPERPPANLRMTGRGYLTRMARIRGSARDERIDDLIGRLGLADWAARA